VRPGECDTVRLESKELLVHALDWRELGSAICRALGFSESQETVRPTAWMHAIGTHQPSGALVYVTLANDEILLAELEKLFSIRAGPFILLTLTLTACTPEAKAALDRNECAQVSLATLLVPETGAVSASNSLSSRCSTVSRSVSQNRATKPKSWTAYTRKSPPSAPTSANFLPRRVARASRLRVAMRPRFALPLSRYAKVSPLEAYLRSPGSRVQA